MLALQLCFNVGETEKQLPSLDILLLVWGWSFKDKSGPLCGPNSFLSNKSQPNKIVLLSSPGISYLQLAGNV